MNSGGQKWHRFEFVPEFDVVHRRSKVLPVLAVLAIYYLLDPPNNAQQVACRRHKVVFQDLVHAFYW